MRSEHDRRRARAAEHYPLEDDQNRIIMEDRRRHAERRVNDLELEERQLLLSEMPGLDHLKDD